MNLKKEHPISVLNIFNRRGFTIIEALVSIGIASIIGLAMMTMVSSQNKEIKGLTEKLVVKDLEAQLQRVITVDDYCSCLFRGSKVVAGNLTTPPAAIPTGFNWPIPAPPAACTPAGTNLIPSAGNTIPGSNIKISGISYSNVIEIGKNQYSANLNVNLDSNSGVRALKGFKVSLVLTADAAGNFLNCGALRSSGAIAVAYRGGGFSVTPAESGLYQVDFIGTVRGRTEGETYIWMTMNGARNPVNATEARCGHRDAGSGKNTWIHCPFHMSEFWNLIAGTTYNFGYGGSFPGGGALLGGGASEAMWIVRKKQ